jgi:ribose 5-phosphate isomerase A
MEKNDTAKRAAAEAAVALIEDGMLVGLGSGTTMRFAIEALSRRRPSITGVPTSRKMVALARELGITLVEPAAAPLDLAIDGADEIEEGALRLIKGAGGALLREKIVAQASRRFVIIGDETKIVTRLGTRMPLPVEMAQFGYRATMARVAALGGRPVLRTNADGSPTVTDSGNLLCDCSGFAPILDPFTLDRELRAIAGVMGTGLFLLPVEQAIIGSDDGSVRVLRPR